MTMFVLERMAKAQSVFEGEPGTAAVCPTAVLYSHLLLFRVSWTKFVMIVSREVEFATVWLNVMLDPVHRIGAALAIESELPKSKPANATNQDEALSAPNLIFAFIVEG